MQPVERVDRSSRDSHADDIRQRLRDLPQELPPPFSWSEFQRRANERATLSRQSVKWQHAAAAAGLAALVASLAIWGRAGHHSEVVPRLAESSVSRSMAVPPGANDREVPPQEERAGTDSASMEDARPALQAAVASELAALARPAASRRWLQLQPPEPALVRVGPRLAVADLEDRIAWVDDALTIAGSEEANAARLHALRKERALLVGSLAQVRYAESLAARTP